MFSLSGDTWRRLVRRWSREIPFGSPSYPCFGGLSVRSAAEGGTNWPAPTLESQEVGRKPSGGRGDERTVDGRQPDR